MAEVSDFQLLTQKYIYILTLLIFNTSALRGGFFKWAETPAKKMIRATSLKRETIIIHCVDLNNITTMFFSSELNFHEFLFISIKNTNGVPLHGKLIMILMNVNKSL